MRPTDDYQEVEARVGRLHKLLGMFAPIPSDWVQGKESGGSLGQVSMDPLPCRDWNALVSSWRKAMKWGDGLDVGLSVILASVVSTRSLGPQLWVLLIGPPSSGKTTLGEALSVNRQYVYPKDTLTGLISGYQLDKEGSENLSLVQKIKDKTLVIKDADTILRAADRPKILSQLRAFYDKALRSQYGNMMSTDHEGINTTIVMMGTSSLYELDSAEFGARFINIVIMDGIDEELEDEVLWRVANRTNRVVGAESNCSIETQYEQSMLEAMRLTGGYVGHLRDNARRFLEAADCSDAMLRRCMTLGKFVAYMRARPPKGQDEHAEREFSPRLVEQMVKLAKCLVVVLGRKSVDDEVMRRVSKVAMDTARGRSLEIVKHLYATGDKGIETKRLCRLTGRVEAKQVPLLTFLRHIGALQYFEVELAQGLRSNPAWRLTERFYRLYSEVLTLQEAPKDSSRVLFP